MSFPFGQKFPELLDESLVFGLGVSPRPAQVVVGEVGDDASLALLLVGGGVVLATLHGGGTLAVRVLSSISLRMEADYP